VLGLEKVGESSGEGRQKIGDIQAPPKTYHKNAYAPKPNPLRNKLDTNLDPPIFPHSTNDFQKPIKFKSNLGNVFFGKESEKPSEENRLSNRVERNQVSNPNPSLNLSLCSFILTIVGEMVTRVSFASRRGVRREWQRSGQTRTGTNHLMVCLSLVCHYLGVRLRFAQFRLGEKRVLWEEGTLLEELNRSDRFGVLV
jgi:hypothetical protein